MFFQIQEWWVVGVWFCKETLGKYLALKVLASKEFGWFWILQYFFEIIAWLMRLNFLKPSPPLLFGWQIIPQLIRCRFLALVSCSHQKAQMIASNLLQVVSGTLQQEKVYRGMAVRLNRSRWLCQPLLATLLSNLVVLFGLYRLDPENQRLFCLEIWN